MRYLVVVAHPDDEVLGVGGTIYKLVNQGHEVAVATMSNSAAARKDISDTLEEDQSKAMRILGVKDRFYADFPNIKMNTVGHLDLVQFIEKCIMGFKADAIITHHPTDTNNDHVVTSYAVQAACRLHLRREGVPELKELLYMEVASSTEWSLDSSSTRFTPNHFVEIGEIGVNKKLEALKQYKGVMRPYPHPRSEEAIRALATYRGAQAGCFYCEAFESVYRRV